MPLAAAKTGTRPTTDRTKEAIFSRLDAWNACSEAHVLDLFAGTGALGIEALSRGAVGLVAVEAAPVAAALVSHTLKQLQTSKQWSSGLYARVERRRAEQFVNDYHGRAFELVFIDPPYAYETRDCQALLTAMVTRGVASYDADTLIVLERSARSDVPRVPDGWELFDQRQYGETIVLFIQPLHK